MATCNTLTNTCTYDKVFGSNFSVPTYKQKVGEIIIYHGVLENDSCTESTIVSVSISTFLENPTTSVGTTNTSSAIIDANTFSVNFDTTDVNLLPGEEYLVSCTISFDTGMVLVRSFRVILTDFFGKTPSTSANSSTIPAYVSVGATSTTSTICTTTGTTNTVTVCTACGTSPCSCLVGNCAELSTYTVTDSVVEVALTNIPASAGAARVDILTDVEFNVNGSVTPNGVPDAINGQSIWLDNIEFPDFRIVGINGTDTFSFTVTYWTCNPYT